MNTAQVISSIHKELSQALAAAGVAHRVEHFTAEGVSVDIALPGRVAVETKVWTTSKLSRICC